jgi:hypothetical protein
MAPKTTAPLGAESLHKVGKFRVPTPTNSTQSWNIRLPAIESVRKFGYRGTSASGSWWRIEMVCQ